MKNGILIIFFSVFFSVTISNAQYRGSSSSSNPIYSGMGNTYTAVSDGIYSIGTNPANLMSSENNHFEFSTILPIPNLTVFGGTNFISFDDINYYFGGVKDANGNTVGRYLTENDKDNLRNLFIDGGIVATDISINYLSLSYKVNDDIGAFAFNISDYFSTYFNFPSGIVDLALTGNPIGKAYDFSGTDFKAWYLRDYSLSYARDINLFEDVIDKFSVGLTVKYIQGFAYGEFDHVKSTFTTGTNSEITTKGDVLAYFALSEDFGVDYDFENNPVNKDFNASIFPEPAGSGIGFDLGFTSKFNDVWTLAFALTDIGSIDWDQNVAEYSSNQALIIDDITDEALRDSVLDTFTGEGKFVNSINRSLASALRIGVSFQLDKFPIISSFPGELLITLDYNQGFNNQPGNSLRPRFSIGSEWKPISLIPIRTGFSFGGRDGFGWAFGTGVNFSMFEFNFAASNIVNWMKANNAKNFSVSVGSRFKF